MKIRADTSEQEVLKKGHECDLCGKCCSYGSGFILKEELPRIARFLKMDEENLMHFLDKTQIFETTLYRFKKRRQDKDRPYGRCIFLKDNRCTIQEVKPLHCRIGNCKEHGDDLHVWFLINKCLNIYDPESIRQYKTYTDTGGRVIEGAELKTLFPDKEKLKKILNYEILR